MHTCTRNLSPLQLPLSQPYTRNVLALNCQPYALHLNPLHLNAQPDKGARHQTIWRRSWFWPTAPCPDTLIPTACPLPSATLREIFFILESEDYLRAGGKARTRKSCRGTHTHTHTHTHIAVGYATKLPNTHTHPPWVTGMSE